jgi:hypothetical protein
MQEIFNIIATVLFFLLGIIWSKKGFANIIFKIILIAVSIIGIIVVLSQYGYIIKK